MPVFTSGPDQAPAWCQMQFFDIVELEPGQTHQYERIGTKEKLNLVKRISMSVLAQKKN